MSDPEQLGGPAEGETPSAAGGAHAADPVTPPAAAPQAPAEGVDRVAEAVLAVPGVVGLHAGSFGEVATYLVGRSVAGIRERGDVTEVHVTVRMGSVLLDVADQVRAAVAAVTAGEVEVVVEDVTAA
ncbi:hypothetical protein SAMN04488570_2027 [Nocardioides scoriae]|uniref:Asp23 family, cell envelope-related function n=1 Tax=Nocardioides scoriae TaxID=642780 RepID=A0A1H1SRM9_9ACTN|nr:hypothetical protein [Nocardioides scoriae]SDS50503.1 hypothetical protein SAMN04488570_2027 [Nocardioides scoriae]